MQEFIENKLRSTIEAEKATAKFYHAVDNVSAEMTHKYAQKVLTKLLRDVQAFSDSDKKKKK